MVLPFNPVTARLEALAACLCAQIEDPANGVPAVCFCGVMPGSAMPVDYSGDCNDACGAAWVRLVSLYPSVRLGVPDTTAGNCGSGVGIDLEVGILRCISVGDEDGSAPSLEELTEATELQLADALVILKAIQCCDAFSPKDVITGQYRPLGPEGGLVGGLFTLTMGV